MPVLAFNPLVPVMRRDALGYPEHESRGDYDFAAYVTFAEACRTQIPFDAHFAAYSQPTIARRLAGDVALQVAPRMVLFVVDVDWPEHASAPASDAWWAAERAKIVALFKARGRGYAYRTRGGYRLVYGLREELVLRTAADKKRWRASYLRWLEALKTEHHIVGDDKCADAFRLFRLPRVVRDGAAVEPADEVGEPDRMLDWREPYVAPITDEPIAAPSVRTGGPVPDDDKLAAAADALVAAWPPRSRHYAGMALCGALAHAGWPAEAVVDFVGYVMANTVGDAELNKWSKQASDVVEKIARGDAVTGWPTLEEHMLTGPDGQPDESRREIVCAAITTARNALGMGPPIDLFKLALEAAKPSLAQQLDEACAELGGDQSFRALLDEAAEKLGPMIRSEEAKANRPLNPSPMGVRGREMLARNLPPPEYLVDALITREGVGALSGEPKCAKSWDATHITVAVASGQPVFGRFAVQRPAATFYLYLEDPESSVNNRRNAIAVGMGIPHDGPWLDNWYAQPRGRAIDIMNEADLCVLVASVWRYEREDRRKIELVVIDPLSNAHSGEEDKRDSMKLVMARLHAVELLLRAGILFTHHSGKSTADSKGRKRGGQKMRGSGAIHGAIDYAIYLDDLRGNSKTEFTARIESEVKSAAQAGVFDRMLVIEDNAKGNAIKATFTAAERAPDSKPLDLADQRAVTVVQKVFDQGAPMTRDELKRKIGGDASILEAAIEIAKSEGWIVQRFQGKRSAGYTITDKGRELIRCGAPAVSPQQNVAPPDHLKPWASS